MLANRVAVDMLSNRPGYAHTISGTGYATASTPVAGARESCALTWLERTLE
jgi:hypothetical protein